MIGLIALIVIGGLLALAVWFFNWTYRSQRRNGKSSSAAYCWAFAALFVLSLPVTWDAVPTWLVFKYYSYKEAEFKVLKTPEKWQVENPEIAEILKTQWRTAKDKTVHSIKLGNGKSRTRLNDRFAYDSQTEQLFLSVGLTRHEIVDTKTGDLMLRFVAVASGSGGGLASGGAGWWKPWLIHRSSKVEDSDLFYRLLNGFQFQKGK